MDEDGFVEVKRKHKKSAEASRDERGNGSNAAQAGRNGRRGNASRTGNRRNNTRPGETSNGPKMGSQRQDTVASRLQRSGRSTPKADSAPASRRTGKPCGAPDSSARERAPANGEKGKNCGAQHYLSVPAVDRRPAWSRANQTQPRLSSATRGVGQAQPSRGVQSPSAVGCVHSHSPSHASPSVSAAGATPINASGDGSAAVHGHTPTATGATKASMKPVSWAAAARASGRPASSAPVLATPVQTCRPDDLRIPGQEKLHIRTQRSTPSPKRMSPSSGQAHCQRPRSTKCGFSTEGPQRRQAISGKATPAPSIASVDARPCAASAEDGERIQGSEHSTPPGSESVTTAPATTASECREGKPLRSEAESPFASPHSVQQSIVWQAGPSDPGSPGEFGDELEVLAHSLTDNSTPPGREHACGILNPHSLCFMIAPLQAMLATRPFQALMSRLPDLKGSLVVAKEVPVLAGLAELADFIRSPSASAFDPAPLSQLVQGHNEREGFGGDGSPFSVAQRQPQLDAALLYLHAVDKIHDEIALIMKRKGFREQAQQAVEEDTGAWNLVGPKKQVRELRQTQVASQGRNTPFGVAFRGVLAHHNRNPGKPESINLEPFTLLNVRPEIGANGRDTVEAGLRRLCSRYRNPDTGQEHRSLIAELPAVLVLQVGRFQYHQNSLQKICAPVEHPMQLQLGKEMLTQDARRQCSVYNLVAKVVHHGQSMNSGHYTTIALEGPGNWMKYDDGTVTQVSPAEAQKPDGYLLFYAVSE